MNAKTILLLEDESALMRLLCLILKNYSLVKATTAEQALGLFADYGHKLDLLVNDMTLPVSSGAEVALHIRSEIPQLPVILTSGYPVGAWSNRDFDSLEKLGLRSVVFLQKPIQVQVLLNTVRELIGSPLAEITKTAPFGAS
jgi:CheY-like chemotaxis protein